MNFRSFLQYPFFALLTLLPGCKAMEENMEERISPEVDGKEEYLSLEREKVGEDAYELNGNWLRKNEHGLWEMYSSGGPFERGAIKGKLYEDLFYYQEKVFLDRIKELVPNEKRLEFLRYFVALFNSSLHRYIPHEYKREIYGVSFSASSDHRAVGPPFYRILNYHAAHDIGHAIQNMNLAPKQVVGCTAFGVKGSKTKDGRLLMGRNFDFYAGEEFEKVKIVSFVEPDTGNAFMSITWPGMIGVVSGMNDEGLSLTLNAAKSKIPLGTGTPVSIIGRRVLQYASDIEEAKRIIAGYKPFVSESFVIGSAEDNKTVVIERSPEKIGVYEGKDHRTVVTNHFQSKPFQGQEFREEHLKENPTLYRYKRVNELLDHKKQMDEKDVIDILRDKRGLNDKNIGVGNEMAVNQLIAHHSIVFEPKEKKVWVSTYPHQSGPFVAYDLDRIFGDPQKVWKERNISLSDEAVPSSEFITSGEYEEFAQYEKLLRKIRDANEKKRNVPEEELERLVELNPEYFESHSARGDQYFATGELEKAKKAYEKALEKEIPRKVQRDHIKEALESCREKTK